MGGKRQDTSGCTAPPLFDSHHWLSPTGSRFPVLHRDLEYVRYRSETSCRSCLQTSMGVRRPLPPAALLKGRT